MFIVDHKKDLLKRAKGLLNRYIKSSGNHDGDLIDVAEWLRDTLRPTIASSTYQKYKASLLAACDDDRLHAEIKKILAVRAARKKDLPKRKTSRLRKKSVPQEDFLLLKSTASNSKSKWADITIEWLRAGIVTGLRPFEWVVADYHQGEDMLYVKNVKLELTVPEWGDSTRKIPLHHLDDEDRISILQTIEIVKSTGVEGYEYLYRQAANWLRRANNKTFPKRKMNITLMSGRHQFCANLKASGLQPKEIAYLMGHATDERAYSTYGATRFGNGIDIASSFITEEALDRVRDKLSRHEERWAKRIPAQEVGNDIEAGIEG